MEEFTFSLNSVTGTVSVFLSLCSLDCLYVQVHLFSFYWMLLDVIAPATDQGIHIFISSSVVAKVIQMLGFLGLYYF